MKRFQLLAAMLLMLMTSAWAQTSQSAVHKVQGIERADLPVPQVMNLASATSGKNVESRSPKRVATRTADEGTVHTVTTLQELVDAVSSAASGDIVQFDESLKDQELDGSGMSDKITIKGKEVNIYGNGVILKNFVGIKFGSEGKGVIKDFIFDDPQGTVIVSNARGYVTIDNCVFRNYIDGNDNLIKAVYTSKYNSHDYYLTVKNCLFENNTLRNVNNNYFGSMIILGGYAQSEHDFTATFVNNTFRGNITNNPSCIKADNKIDLVLINNVFEENKNKGGSIDINIGENIYLTSAYNVISGGINDVYQAKLSETDQWAEDLALSYQEVEGKLYVIPDSPAYQNLPANTEIEGVEFPTTDIYGNTIDYTQPTNSGCSQLVYVPEETTDYSDGVFILNEDWYGHCNSTINFLSNDGEWTYRVIQKENEGVQLGCTAQYGTIYGGKMYIVAKQDKDPGAKIRGGRLTIADALTMKVEKQIQQFAVNGFSGTADGRAFVGVNEHKGYISTSNGIFILNLDTQELTSYITTGENSDDLYSGQVGNMVRVGDYVFANHQNKGLLVINADDDIIERSILGPDGETISTFCLANDGNLWLMSGSSLLKLNPYTLEYEAIAVPDGVSLTSEGWGAWRPSTFCASRQHNALYWASGTGWGDICGVVYKYDIDTNEFSEFIKFSDEEGWKIYGSAFRIDPVTDNAIMCLFKAYGDQSYITRRYNDQGEMIAEYPMEKNYWFPTIPIFPDTALPEINPIPALDLESQTVEISLADLATDADNMIGAIVKTIISNSNKRVATASIMDDNLYISPIKPGTTVITIQVNSNGQIAQTSVEVTVKETSGIENITNDGVASDIYSIDGVRTDRKIRGINIIRNGDGTVSKVYIK